MFLELKRLENTRSETVGALMLNGVILCYTLELSDNANKRGVSRIPEGLYTCKRYTSATHQNTFIVEDVLNRSYILFHVANTTADLEGCIGLGEKVGYLNGVRAVLGSRNAFNSFLEATEDVETFKLRALNG